MCKPQKINLHMCKPKEIHLHMCKIMCKNVFCILCFIFFIRYASAVIYAFSLRLWPHGLSKSPNAFYFVSTLLSKREEDNRSTKRLSITKLFLIGFSQSRLPTKISKIKNIVLIRFQPKPCFLDVFIPRKIKAF